MKVFICALVFCFMQQAFAQNCDNLKKIDLPTEFIHAYIKPQNNEFIFPLLEKYCLRKNMSFDVYAGDSFYGKIQVKDFTKERLTDAFFNAKTTDQKYRNFYKNMYKNKIRPIDFIKLWTFFLDPKMKYQANKPMYLVTARVTSTNLNFKSWNPYKIANKHWAAKNITYNELLKFIAKDETYFVSLTPPRKFPHNPKRVEFKFPDILPKLKLKFRHDYVLFDFFDLFGLPLSSNNLDANVIVETRAQQSSDGYNAITELFFRGYRNIYWFNNSLEKWFGFKSKPKYFDEGFDDFFDIKKFFTYMKDEDVKIYDFSKSSFSNTVRLKKSLVLGSKLVSAKDYADFIAKNTNTNDKILLIGWGKFNTRKKLSELHSHLKARGYKDVKVFKQNAGQLFDSLVADYSVKKVKPYFYEKYETHGKYKKFEK